tara:strand:- start:60 stop:572 length:513 start_codon:yes stop_codon:yes gene_type:complete
VAGPNRKIHYAGYFGTLLTIGLMALGVAIGASSAGIAETTAPPAETAPRGMADLDAAVDRNPQDIDALFDRARAHARGENFDAAIADYSRVLALDPGNVAALHRRGIAYSDNGEYEKAIADFDAGVKITPRDSLLLLNRGMAHARNRDEDRAIQDFTRVIGFTPDYGFAY